MRSVSTRTGLPHPTVDRLLKQMEDAGLVLAAAGPGADEVSRFCNITSTWRLAGWEEAAEYHLSTLDYPFVDYEHGGRDLDTARMQEYVRREPDTNRYKQYPEALERVYLPAPTAELIPASLAHGLRNGEGGDLNRERMLRLLSMACAETGRISSGRWMRAPMIRRTSPSGGARHPTETYLLVLDVQGLTAGWYHVAVGAHCLERLSGGLPTDEELREAFPLGYERVPIEPSAIVVLTSIFARNMYRYREPRTFRTLHMDVGHLASTLAMAAAALDVRVHIVYPDNDELIENMIGVYGLSEGYMLSISLGTAVSEGTT